MNRPFVNGNREQTNNFTVDGFDVNETIDNRVAYQPIPDALAEISVETNNYSADVGNVGGAVINSVVKSGANQFHGNAFEFYRNSDFDANTLGEQSIGRREAGTEAAHFRRHGWRPHRRAIACSSLAITRDRGTITRVSAPLRWPRKPGGAAICPASPRTIRDPRTGLPFPGNQIPVGSHQFDGARAAERPDQLPAAQSQRARAGFPGTSSANGSSRFGRTRAMSASTGAPRTTTSSSAVTRSRCTKTSAISSSFPLVQPTSNDQPFYNVGGNWNRIFGPSLVNELLVGFSNTKVVVDTFDWAGVGSANALYGIAGGQPIAGLSQIGWGSGLTLPGAIATDSDTLAKTYQINDKATWVKGRHTVKFGGQFLHYDQQRFYAGNNGLLGFINFSGAFTGFAFSDFLLDMVSGKGRGGGDPNDPWTHLQNRVSLFAQDDFKILRNLTLNLGLRWAYTSPLVEQDNRQSNFDLVTGRQIFATDGSIEERALYKPYYKGYEPRIGAAYSATDRLVFRGGYGITQFMEGTGANLRLPLNPPFFFESAVAYDATTGAGTAGTGFAELIPGTTPSGNVRAYDPNLRPQFSQQFNVFGEYRLTSAMSAQIGYVGHHATHLVTPVEGNQALPGVGDPATWAPKNTRRPLFGPLPLVTTIATTAARSGSNYHSLQASVRQRTSNGVEFLASYTLGKTRTNNRGFYGVFGGTGLQGVTSATEGAYWQNTYDPDAEWGPAFHDVRHNAIFSATYELPFGKGGSSPALNAIIGGWRVGGIFQARSGLPITVTDGRSRSLQGERGAERPNCVGDPVPSDQSIDHWLDINAFQTVALGTFGNCPVGVARAPGYTNLDLMFSKRIEVGGPRYGEFRIEAFNALNHPSFGPPARDISVPNTFGTITSTISSPRVVELVFKFYF